MDISYFHIKQQKKPKNVVLIGFFWLSWFMLLSIFCFNAYTKRNRTEQLVAKNKVYTEH